MSTLTFDTLSSPITFARTTTNVGPVKSDGSFCINSFWIWMVCFLLTLSSPSVSAQMQDLLAKRVTISNGRLSTVDILNDISQQAGVVFSYSNRICLNKSNDIAAGPMTLKSLLDQLFRLCPVSYIVKGNKIIIEPQAGGAKRFVVKGFVRDGASGEVLIGANIYEPFLLTGQNSNNFGFYSLTLPEGEVSLFCSFVGCQTHSQSIFLEKDTVIDFYLKSTIDIEQIDILGTRKPGKVQSTATGIVDIPVEQIQSVPSFMGEVDVIKTLQLAPGVQSGNEGAGGFYVRGGGADENLILLDDVPIYNVSHMLGFFSVFNADAINKVTMTKSGFPARYGGRLSSVLDIRLKEGDLDDYHGTASFGLLSSRLSVEGPIKKDVSSFYLSGRRTYLDLFSSPLQLSKDEKMKYYFYDVNGKFNFIFSNRDRVYLSVFSGTDEYDTYFNYRTVSLSDKVSSAMHDVAVHDENGSGWGSQVVSARWNHVFGNKMFANFTLLYSNFRFYVDQILNSYKDLQLSEFKQRYYSGIRDRGVKADFDYFPSSSHHVRFGVGGIYHEFYPGIDVVQSGSTSDVASDTTVGAAKFFRPEYHAYIEDDFSLGDRVKMNLGVHFSAMDAGETLYGSVEPRVSLLFLLRDDLSVKAAYTHMTQYVHLVRNSSIMLPSDMWLPVSGDIAPLRSQQWAAGLEWEINKATNLSLEGYYKKQSNILTYRESIGLFGFNSDWASRLVAGEGDYIGAEVFFHKKVGRWAGWLSYTLSRSMNTFKDVNNGKAFPANYDRLHDASLFGTYKFKHGVDFSFNWIYGTGYPVTLSTSKYYSPDLPTQPGQSNGGGYDIAGERNSFRMASVHRLDLGVNFVSQKSWGTRVWSFGVYNAYSRQNPFFLYFGEKEDSKTGKPVRVLKQYSMFPIALPYARVTIKF